jgi:hypothetical protein
VDGTDGVKSSPSVLGSSPSAFDTRGRGRLL